MKVNFFILTVTLKILETNASHFQKILVTSDSLLTFDLENPVTVSSLIECSALCNVKAGCDMFAFDPSYQCSTGQSFDNTLIMDEYNGVPVYLRDPNSDGYWDQTWTEWGPCSATRGPGFHQRTDTCIPHWFQGEPCNPADQMVETEICYDPSVLWIFTGRIAVDTDTPASEIIILDNNGLACESVNDFPLGGVTHPFFGFTNGKAVVCNGAIPGNTAYTLGGQCWTYDFGSASWQDQTDHFNMPDHAWNIVSLQINDNDFAILGGSSAYFALYQGFSFQSYSLPDDITGFPAFLIATSKILLVGGHNIITNDYVDTLYMFDIDNVGAGWSLVGNLPRPRKESFGGIITHKNGLQELVIAGGIYKDAISGFENEITDEVLIMSLVNYSTRSGPSLSNPTRKARSQPFGTTFIIINGAEKDTTRFYNDIYEFDVENEAWIERAEKSAVPSQGAGVFLSHPGDIVPCS